MVVYCHWILQHLSLFPLNSYNFCLQTSGRKLLLVIDNFHRQFSYWALCIVRVSWSISNQVCSTSAARRLIFICRELPSFAVRSSIWILFNAPNEIHRGHLFTMIPQFDHCNPHWLYRLMKLIWTNSLTRMVPDGDDRMAVIYTRN